MDNVRARVRSATTTSSIATTTSTNNGKLKLNDHQKHIFIVFAVFAFIFFILIISLMVSFAWLMSSLLKDSEGILNDYLNHYLKNWPNLIIQLLTLLTLSSACLSISFACYLLRDQFKISFPFLDSCKDCYNETTTTKIIDDNIQCDDLASAAQTSTTITATMPKTSSKKLIRQCSNRNDNNERVMVSIERQIIHKQ